MMLDDTYCPHISDYVPVHRSRPTSFATDASDPSGVTRDYPHIKRLHSNCPMCTMSTTTSTAK
jgi:hypothetical protein